MTERRRAFVCGHPVAHSRSPLIHGYWLRRYGIPGSYEAVDRAPDRVHAFLTGLGAEGFVGGNVTIPHKEAAFAACAEVDETARRIGAVNTVWLEDGILRGGNTDAHGFCANLDEHVPGWADVPAAVVLGAGGAARAVVEALGSRGIGDIRIVNRTLPRARELKDRFGGGASAHALGSLRDLLADCRLLVNTTAAGMEGHEDLQLDLSGLPDEAIVTDIVYTPLVTPLLASARRRGLRTVDGLGMLLHQAVPGFERWFGHRPEVTDGLRRLVEKDLGS
ncbi:MAG: shikimate dehydrogenase [Rhizobiaceae bacterium]|nr:shikimate dehydrogenase [Rhizobiaceae bacterium]MCV0404668.1 shikimate dehydrogenase [Rhizobiaceae bacterium]